MSVREFGHFDAPLVLFGGVGANLQALKALSGVVGGDPAISTGGLIGRGAEATRTVSTARLLGWPMIAGERDRAAARDAGMRLDDADRAWLNALPDIGTLVQKGRRYAVVHASALNPARHIWPVTSDEDLRAEIAAIEFLVGAVDGVIAGHSGIAFHRRVGAHQWINAGSIGVPPHDGRPETRYVLLKDGDVIIHRLSYDHESAVKAVDASRAEGGFGKVLRTGIWENDDTLPPELRR